MSSKNKLKWEVTKTSAGMPVELCAKTDFGEYKISRRSTIKWTIRWNGSSLKNRNDKFEGRPSCAMHASTLKNKAERHFWRVVTR